MRRDNHRRRGLNRASSGGWGHRAVYVGAAVATAALLAGFGAAVLLYGPLGTPSRQIAGTTLNVPPRGVEFGSAFATYASALDLTNASAGNVSWNWSGGGPCNGSGIYYQNHTFSNTTNNVTWNGTVSGGNTTLVCLNGVVGGNLTASWYWNATQAITHNTYNATNGLRNSSYYNASGQNISACNETNEVDHMVNLTSAPCDTYFEMNNNTSYLWSGAGTFNSTGGYNNSTVWSPNQSGYAPDDVVYAVPVVFLNSSVNGTYEISVALAGVTPVAQTFVFNNTMGNTSSAPALVLFTFDMTAAWLMDLSVNATGNATATNLTNGTMLIYGSVGIVSAIVTECGAYATSSGLIAVCPVEDPYT